MNINNIISSEIQLFLNENVGDKIPKDDRKLTWKEIEDDVQFRAKKKDKSFKLEGKWKVFKENRDGFKIYIVNGEYVRNNLSIIFGHGGHGLVHEFIPHDEIWIASHHYDVKGLNGISINCGCNKGNQKISDEYYLSCSIHEMSEYNLMKTGMHYWKAHQMSLDIEETISVLPKKEI